jgi:hypothetical protein
VTLQYESILYEQAHFKKEIAIARDFKYDARMNK